MKIKDFLAESNVTDIVARFYVQASKDSDRYYNPENVKYKEKTQAFYQEFFKDWFDDEIVPIFKKPVTKAQPPFTNKPKDGKSQSPGYRGLQYAKAASGLPYDHTVQDYRSTPGALQTRTMDELNNG